MKNAFVMSTEVMYFQKDIAHLVKVTAKSLANKLVLQGRKENRKQC